MIIKSMKNTPLRIKNTEFDWLEYCTSCNHECCHNTNPPVPKNECIKPGIENNYTSNMRTNVLTDKVGTDSGTNTEIAETHSDTYDNRPLGCQIFPMSWI
jgi:hypothetical protein